jgi:hypothetical protein
MSWPLLPPSLPTASHQPSPTVPNQTLPQTHTQPAEEVNHPLEIAVAVAATEEIEVHPAEDTHTTDDPVKGIEEGILVATET